MTTPQFKKMSMKRNIIIISTAITILIFGVIYVMVVDEKNVPISTNQPVTNTAETVSDVIRFEPNSTYGTLLFPQVGISIELPTSYFQMTEAQVAAYNSGEGEYQIDNACRVVDVPAGSTFGLWISYDTQTSFCATERIFSLLKEPQFQGDISQFCGGLVAITNYKYGGCGILENPPNGFRGFSYYQFVPDYGVEGSGQIVQEVYLQSISNPAKQIIFGYVPAENYSVQIQPDEFEAYVSKINAGQIEGFQADTHDAQMFNSIVRSLEVNE